MYLHLTTYFLNLPTYFPTYLSRYLAQVRKQVLSKQVFNLNGQVGIQVGRYIIQPTYLNVDLNSIWTNSINMPHGNSLLHHMSQSKPSKHKNKCLELFQNNNKIFLIIKSWYTWKHITCSHCSPKNCILVASDNTCMTSQSMKVYFVDLFFHPKFVVVYDLSNVTIKILVANVACN